MSNGKFLIHLAPKDGINCVFSRGQYNMNLTSFALLKLQRGGVYKSETGSNEVALVLLGGKCSIKGPEFEFPEVGGRKIRLKESLIRYIFRAIRAMKYALSPTWKSP